MNPTVIPDTPIIPVCCCCQRPGAWRQVGDGRRPFCDKCWQSHLEFIYGRAPTQPSPQENTP